MRIAALLVSLAAVALGAQQPAAPPVSLLVRQDVVSPVTLQRTAGLGIAGFASDAVWLGEQRYALDDVAVDLAAMEVLEVSRDRVVLRTAGKQVLWAVDRAAAGVAAGSKSAHWLLLGARIVLPRAGGGLVGLERKTGAVSWQHGEAPSELAIADGDLVIGSGLLAGKPTLAAFAAPNGARAFSCVLPAPATRIVAGPHGIAVATADGVVVHDRSGPLLFTKAGAVIDLRAGPDGWFLATGETLQAWDRTGKVLWNVPNAVERHMSLGLAVTGSGALLDLRHQPMSDSGVTVVCRDPQDGGVLWRHVAPGLEIDHSKYWHCAHARAIGDAVFVVSQAAGGNFVVELDAETGEKRRRETFGVR